MSRAEPTVRRSVAARLAGAMLAAAVLAVLGFAALGLHDTLTGGSSILYRIMTGLLRLTVLVFAAIGVLDVARGSALRRVRAMGKSGRAAAPGQAVFRSTMELLTGTPLARGHEAHVLLNGDETYPRLFEELRAARRSVVMQLYYCEPGRMADELGDILVERVRAGVPVFLLVDAFGAQELPRSWFDFLRQEGVEVAAFRPIHWYSLNRANNRSHVRVVAIDGVIGYTGGFGIADKWYGDGRSAGQWRETNVRFTGPAVAQLLAAFVVGWAEATGELLAVDTDVTATPDMPVGDTSAGGIVAGFLHTPPTLGSTRAERFLSLTIAGARERLYITNAYFVPDASFRALLVNAARRGVDVRVLTAGAYTDVRTMLYGGRARYTALLRAGVRVYEYRSTMMHAKTLVVDGVWGAIGSMNFDNRSMVLNDEGNFVALDHTLGTQLESIFRTDLDYTREITLADFSKRPRLQRIGEWFADQLTRFL